MIVFTTYNKRYIDVGSDIVWRSVRYTIHHRLPQFYNEVPLAIDFLKTGRCSSTNAIKTARQMNLIRDALSRITPSQAVFNDYNPSEKAPWGDNISEVSTSCGNLFITSDGKDLLFEIVSLLSYASVTGNEVDSDGLEIE